MHASGSLVLTAHGGLGVQALHRNSILHRDLKSANVFLASHNRLKIGDLGVAKLLRAQEAYAKTQIGTPYYMSPELLRDQPYGAPADVWALGVVLYELAAAGQRPVEVGGKNGGWQPVAVPPRPAECKARVSCRSLPEYVVLATR